MLLQNHIDDQLQKSVLKLFVFTFMLNFLVSEVFRFRVTKGFL